MSRTHKAKTTYRYIRWLVKHRRNKWFRLQSKRRINRALDGWHA